MSVKILWKYFGFSIVCDVEDRKKTIGLTEIVDYTPGLWDPDFDGTKHTFPF